MMIRGIVKAVTDGAVRLLSASGLTGQSFEKREFIQHYGMASRPKEGAEVVISVQGNVITAIGSDDRRYRIALGVGEVALYTDEGDKVHLKRNRIIEIVGGEKVIVTTKVAEIKATTSATVTSPEVTVVASSRVLLDTPLVHCTADLLVDGNINSGANIVAVGNISDANGSKSMSGMRTTYNSHTHGDPQGGSVAATVQVM